MPSNKIRAGSDGYFFPWAINDTYWGDWVQRQRMGDVELDLVTRKAKRGDAVTALSSREAMLLTYLIRHS